MKRTSKKFVSYDEVQDVLMNAKSIKFFRPEDNNGEAEVFFVFDDLDTGIELYADLVKINGTNLQYLGFKKSYSSLIVSFILERTGNAHAKMLLDYDEKEFDAFIASVKPTDSYTFLFGQIWDDGYKRVGGFKDQPIKCNQYRIG